MKKNNGSKKLPYVIIRCRDAGVHAGELVARKGREVVLANSRRLWYWTGAASLSELSVYGSRNPGGCKFAACIGKIELLEACEVIYTQPAGEKMIREQPEWRA
jgi:hypothetical protein